MSISNTRKTSVFGNASLPNGWLAGGELRGMNRFRLRRIERGVQQKPLESTKIKVKRQTDDFPAASHPANANGGKFALHAVVTR
jgi:hypothetical protein